MPGAQAVLEVFTVSLRLGLTSFGGPVAHLGYLRDAYVVRRAWLTDEGFADLVALCQVLPGPASSQVNMSVGFARAGGWGAAAAWAGFTLPSAVLLAVFAFLVGATDVLKSGWLHGIMITAVAVVAQALWGMAARLAPDLRRATMAAAAAVLSLLLPTALTQVLLIAAGALAGWLLLPAGNEVRGNDFPFHIPKGISIFCLSLFFVLLAGLPILRALFPVHWLALVESFYRTGSMVFGGGHVVLPLLH
ncbi:MAG TPA: chromate efflux transporter, partial [Spirochaetia bacterium]|nr:chromate efflux transporter [Spirochaetia bacterium]